MQYTTNYNLGKPEAATDNISPDPYNTNMDTIDTALHNLNDSMQPAEVYAYTGSGVEVTATLGERTVTATAGADGWAVLSLPKFGDWTLAATISGTSVDETVTVDTIKTYKVTMATLELSSWEDIATVSESGLAAEVWDIGDTKTITVNGVSYTAVVIGFDHDTLTTTGDRTTAGITFQLQNCLATTYKMNSSDTNSGGWTSCLMRTSTMATLLSQLSADLQGVLKFVNKLTSAGSQSATINTTSDKLFLLSEIEVHNTTTYSKAGEGSQYAYYAAGNSKVKTGATVWWHRSPRGTTSTQFTNTSNVGNVNYIEASGLWGVAFAFCV